MTDMNLNSKRQFGVNYMTRMAIAVVAVMLVFCGILPLTVATASEGNEEPSAWARGDVSYAIAQGLVPPQLQGNYTQPATRAEFCALVVALYETVTDGEIEGRIEFIDTSDVNVEKAAYIGVVLGVDVNINIFDPDANLNRQQAATMLARLANAIDKPLPPVPPIFDDNDKIAEWAFAAVGKGQAGGIMRGVGEDLFAPLDSYTREQCITTIMRLHNMYEVLYEDESVLAYTAGSQLKVCYKRATEIIEHDGSSPPENAHYSAIWHYTPNGDFIGGRYLGDSAFMPFYRYKDGAFEMFLDTGSIVDADFSGDYLHIIYGNRMGHLGWNVSEASNLLQISLVDKSEKNLGYAGFIYGWSEDRITSQSGAGSRYDPDKMVWEVREDEVYIFGYRRNPEDGAMVREESGFYLVDINGNGHRLIKGE